VLARPIYLCLSNCPHPANRQSERANKRRGRSKLVAVSRQSTSKGYRLCSSFRFREIWAWQPNDGGTNGQDDPIHPNAPFRSFSHKPACTPNYRGRFFASVRPEPFFINRAMAFRTRFSRQICLNSLLAVCYLFTYPPGQLSRHAKSTRNGRF